MEKPKRCRRINHLRLLAEIDDVRHAFRVTSVLDVNALVTELKRAEIVPALYEPVYFRRAGTKLPFYRCDLPLTCYALRSGDVLVFEPIREPYRREVSMRSYRRYINLHSELWHQKNQAPI